MDAFEWDTSDDIALIRTHLLEWIAIERREYADVKYAEDGDNRAMLKKAMEDGDWQRWTDFAGNYVRRAEMFGLNTLQGKQALGKAIVTLMHTLETAIEFYGDMPKPGVSSTDGVSEWR